MAQLKVEGNASRQWEQEQREVAGDEPKPKQKLVGRC